MGVSPFSKSCFTNDTAPAPNPNPGNWELLDKVQLDGVYLLKVKYIGCTNFEGIKIMLYLGTYSETTLLDPHFSPDSTSPIARFKPDELGWELALAIANGLSRRNKQS